MFALNGKRMLAGLVAVFALSSCAREGKDVYVYKQDAVLVTSTGHEEGRERCLALTYIDRPDGDIYEDHVVVNLKTKGGVFALREVFSADGRFEPSIVSGTFDKVSAAIRRNDGKISEQDIKNIVQTELQPDRK